MSKYKDPGYREQVRTWARRLRHADRAEEHQADARASMLGSLQTGGRAGFLPPSLIPAVGLDGHFGEQECTTDMDLSKIEMPLDDVRSRRHLR